MRLATTNLADQRRLVPFMHQHCVSPVQRLCDIERTEAVRAAAQLWIELMKVGDGTRPLLTQPTQAPAIFGLIDIDLMAERLQLADDAPQEVSVAVIPVGY